MEVLTITTKQLKEKLGCGEKTALRIGEAASAKIKIGKRVLWNVQKIQAYLDEVSK